MDDERLTEDTLFLACTRPAMILGVPVEAMIANMMLAGILFLMAGSLIYLAVAPVLHVIFRGIVKYDPNAFRLLFLWMETKGRTRNGGYWGGGSPTPLRVARPSAKTERRYA